MKRYLTGIQTRLALWMLLVLVMPAGAAEQMDEAQLWQGLGSGKYIAIMRHALAPGTGDPTHFKVDDCSTQRNLSAAGQQQAKRIGQRFRDNGVDQATVYSSQWCRCLETARLLALGEVTELPRLNSFFNNRGDGQQQTRDLKHWLRQQDKVSPLVLVAHQVNITALTGVYPSSGEMVIFQRPDATQAGADYPITVVGTLETD